MEDSGVVQVWPPQVEAEGSQRRPARLDAESDAVVKSDLGSPRRVRHPLITAQYYLARSRSCGRSTCARGRHSSTNYCTEHVLSMQAGQE